MNPVQGAIQQTQQDQPTPEDMLQATNQALLKKRKVAMQQAFSNPITQPQEQNNTAPVSQALATLNPDSKSTAVAAGKAISNDSKWANLCEAYAEKAIHGVTGLYPTAINAFQQLSQAGNIVNTIKNIPKNAQIFWDADSSNGKNGHTMVSNGDGTFRSPLSDGSIRDFTIPDWQKYSGQQFLGWAPPPTKG